MAIDAIEMSVENWISIPDNPRQRNTEARARNAVNKHLSEYNPIHRFVYAATIDNNIVCKLDGHTRAMLWKLGHLEHPPSGKVVVLMIEVKSLNEAKDVYDTLDSSYSLKQPRDLVYGATREGKFLLTSHLLRQCSFLTQMKLISVGKPGDAFSLVKKWKKELIDLDGLKLTSKYTILIGLMLLAIKRDGIDTAGKFFVALDQNLGVKESGLSDGVEALNQHLLTRKANGAMAGYENLNTIISYAWYAYESWLAGKKIKSIRSTKSVADIVKEVEGVTAKRF